MTAPVSGISWGGDWIVFGQSNGIHRVSANGGAPEVVVPIEGNQRVSSPQVIDEKGSILFSFQVDPRDADDQARQVVVQAPDGTRHVVLTGGSDARYLPSGYLVYALGPTLLAVPLMRRPGVSLAVRYRCWRDSRVVSRNGRRNMRCRPPERWLTFQPRPPARRHEEHWRSWTRAARCSRCPCLPMHTFTRECRRTDVRR